MAQLYWRSSSPTIAVPVLLQALALSKEYRLQYLASETVLSLAFAQVRPSLCVHACVRAAQLRFSPGGGGGHGGKSSPGKEDLGRGDDWSGAAGDGSRGGHPCSVH